MDDTATLVLPDGPEQFKVVGTFDTDAAQMGASLVAILVGLVASVSPARRAIKEPVLDAVRSE